MSAPPPVRDPARELREVADAFTGAHQARIAAGERLRSALGRQAQTAARRTDAGPPDSVLAAVRQGEHDGPTPELGRAYRARWREEQELARSLEKQLATHPAWPWLRRIPAIAPTVLGRLVARLDVSRAETPSSFWAYCGLATVPGVEHRCSACGLQGTYPEGQRIDRGHHLPGGTEACPGRLRPVADPDPRVRVAQPRSRPGERAAYDAEAKRICYLIGTSLACDGGEYQRLFQRERSRLDGARPEWPPSRKHLAALRRVEKLFLAQLWIVWRQALDLPITRPHANAQEEHDGWIDPWKMVAAPQPRRWTCVSPAPPLPGARA